MGSAIFGIVLMAIDTFSIVFRGKRCRIGKSRMAAVWQPRRGGLEQLTQAGTPRVFSMQLYFAHVNGASIKNLSHELKLPEDWVEESVEAARMCVEFEMPAVSDTRSPAGRKSGIISDEPAA
jgi:hypothetical protein